MDRVNTPWGEEYVSVDPHECPYCGHVGHVYKPLENNRSIQVRCEKCDKFHMNAKYDRREKSEIQRDAINRWLLQRNDREDRCADVKVV